MNSDERYLDPTDSVAVAVRAAARDTRGQGRHLARYLEGEQQPLPR
jgi:hypothetical protein